MKDESKLTDIERSALAELRAQGEISMFHQSTKFSEAMTTLVKKGFVKVKGMAWILPNE